MAGEHEAARARLRTILAQYAEKAATYDVLEQDNEVTIKLVLSEQ